MSVVLLSGGSGGAKLARGLYDIVGAELAVIANTGDDIEIYGACVSPDPDLITYWLADRIDERGWGIAGDTFEAMAMLRELGVDVWFNLGDRDLALCLERRRLLDEGRSATEAHGRLAAALGVRAHVMPMSDQPVATRIRTSGGWVDLQEFMVRLGANAPIDDIEFAGSEDATPSPAVLAAIKSARAIIVGPSNPVISIGPILALSGMREALTEAAAPIVAVSPIVDGAVLKGPTAECLAWAGLPASTEGVSRFYDGLLNGIVSDDPAGELASLRCETLMSNAEQRRFVAQRALELCDSLSAA
ncbi:MAG TPA: 2-phospho-L-lactate transferase [Solirubrobacteraceae bacterium]|nr:2-phospho-L-lactate transferase [Solirubrobacteraceae bacterium]